LKVSVITPSYNQGAFIEETINSVLNQDYPNIEYIIIDGGSTDNTLNIIKSYEDQISYWHSGPDSGQSSAINKGFIRSSGDIIAWLNSDDLYLPGAVSEIVRTFHDNSDAVVVSGTCNITDENGILKSQKSPFIFDTENLLRTGKVPGQPAVFMKREILNTVGLLQENLHFVLDWEYWLRISMKYPKHRIIALNRVIAEARDWEGNKTSIGFKRSSDSPEFGNFVEKRHVLDDLFKSKSLPLAISIFKNQSYSRIYWNQARQENILGFKREARKHFRKAIRLSPKENGIWQIFTNYLSTYISYSIARTIKKILNKF